MACLIVLKCCVIVVPRTCHSEEIRTEMFDPIELETDPTPSEDGGYVSSIYREVQASIQDRLAQWRSFPILG